MSYQPANCTGAATVRNRLLSAVFLLFLGFFKPAVAQGPVTGKKLQPVATAVANMAALSEYEKMLPKPMLGQAKIPNIGEKYREPDLPISPYIEDTRNNHLLEVVSPSAALNYQGSPDEAQGGGTSGIFNIPPDTYGAVGLDKVFVTLNNNYKVMNKTTGAQLSLVSMPSFWATLGADGAGAFDPRVVYDPYNNRWIHAAVSNAQNAASRVLLAISQTHDPLGNYNLYAFDPDAGTVNWADFPMLGFNKNWISISVNLFTVAANANAGTIVFAIDYPTLRAGTANATAFPMTTASGFCHNPAETFSDTENTLYVPAHNGSGSASYRLSTITGTAAAPVFTLGTILVRPGGGWAQPGGNVGPQQCLSSCPGVLTLLDVGDAFIRSNAVYRNGEIWYTQSVGLPTGTFARVSTQWTRLDGSGAVLDGGRIDDPTATSSNGGRWYTYPSVSVNSAGDMLSGFTKLESDGYAGGAYAMRLSGDAAGTTQDPVVFKDGEDYYDKASSGRTRWGDYSHVAVDPLDDISFWTMQEYARPRAAPTVFSTTAKWGTWVAKVAPSPNLSTGTGNWNNAGTWSKGTVPVAGDDVNILAGNNITLNVNPAARTITVNEGATLTVNAARTLSCKLIVYGTLNITGGSLTLGSNDVFLSRNATLTGATSTAYFVTNGTGVVTKMIGGGSSFEFPLSANGSSYNSLTVALAAGDPEEVFSVRVATGINPTSVNNSACVQRTWNISEMTTGGNNATLTFKWAAAEHGAGFSAASAPFAYRHNGSAYLFTRNMTLPVLSGGIYSSSTTGTAISAFSPWIVSGSATLPVKFEYFNGTRTSAGTHLLNWKSTCTADAAAFELQRSADGVNFTTITTIQSDYNRCLQPFGFNDINPLNGKNFYRVKVKDETNAVKYSHIVLLLNSKSGFEIVNLQPNPVSNTAVLNISAAEREELMLAVTDSRGSRVLQKTIQAVAGSNQEEINMTNFPAGAYILSVTSLNGQQKVLRFIKQ